MTFPLDYLAFAEILFCLRFYGRVGATVSHFLNGRQKDGGKNKTQSATNHNVIATLKISLKCFSSSSSSKFTEYFLF